MSLNEFDSPSIDCIVPLAGLLLTGTQVLLCRRHGRGDRGKLSALHDSCPYVVRPASRKFESESRVTELNRLSESHVSLTQVAIVE